MIFVVLRDVNMLTKIERREKRSKLRSESVCRIVEILIMILLVWQPIGWINYKQVQCKLQKKEK